MLAHEGDQSEIERLVPSVMVGKFRIVGVPRSLSRAELYNEAARHSASQFLVFFDPSCEVSDASWLSQMMGYARMKGAGAVGARVNLADGTVDEAGIVQGLNEGLAGRAFQGLQPVERGYLGLDPHFSRMFRIGNACLLVRASIVRGAWWI